MKKHLFAKVVAVIFAVAMILTVSPAALLYAGFAANDTYVFMASDAGDGLAYENDCYEPIPLLVIRISFDPNGNGINDYDPNDQTKLINKDSEYYGEQWIYSKASSWYTTLFEDNFKSLKNYYKEISDGKFWFYPAEESGGTENDGIVDVVIKQKHPDAIYGHNSSSKTKWANERQLALKAADEYVDYAKFDKNGDGVLQKKELAVMFVIGGVEASSYSGDAQKYFWNHAHYTGGSAYTLDGVKVCGEGFVRVGEFMGAERTLTVGTIAHELGHFLGAADLYDTSTNSNKYGEYVGSMSLMGNGNHNRKDGEASGQSPSHLDPYHALKFGFCGYTPAANGEYTLYSRQSTEGKYSVLRINTPNPKEYYLVENRYNVAAGHEEYFDSNSFDQKGIVIWHIDESVNTANRSDKGNDPMVTVLSANKTLNAYGAFRNNETDAANKKQFVNTNYKFPVSGTFYTLLTEEEAKDFKVTIDILSEGANEMKIKVTTSYTSGPYGKVTVSDKGLDNIVFTTKITTMNGGKFVSCGYIISDKADVTEENGTKVTCKPDENGVFSHEFTGLASGKKDYYKAFIESNLGTTFYDGSAITLLPVKEKDYATFYLCQNMPGTRGGFYNVKVYPGNTLKYSLAMKRTNYSFGGWYYDEDFSGDRYDMSAVKNDKTDVYLYAKWIKTTEAAILKFENATPKFPVYAVEVGDTFMTPYAEERAGYKFGGWYEDAEFTSEFDFGKPADESGVISVYAKWISESGEPETSGTTATTGTTVATGTTDTTGTADITTASGTEASTSETTADKENGGIDTGVIVVFIAAAIAIIGCFTVVITKKKK